MERFSEIGKVEAIRRMYEGTPFQVCQQCSFTSTDNEKVASASRLLIEGTDFDLVYYPLKHLGYKSVVMVTGELYASMCEARTLDVVIGVSAKLDFEQIRELFSGIALAAEYYGYRRVSLDLIPSRNGLAISVSAHGAMRTDYLNSNREPVSKDLLCITGSLGAAYLGLQILEAEKRNFEAGKQPDLEKYKAFVGAYLKPDLQAHIPSRLKEAGINPGRAYMVSKGLADALLRLTSDTGLGAKIYTDRIPFTGDSFTTAGKFGIDAMTAALNGGEDARILFTIPLNQFDTFRHDFQEFEVIGHMALAEAGAVIVLPDGVELPVKAQGWQSGEE